MQNGIARPGAARDDRNIHDLVISTEPNDGETLSPSRFPDRIASRCGRTVIAIAHRLATLRNFDRVVVLQGGRIIEDGPPDILVQGRGPYRELVAREMGRLASHAA